jgi:dienelactone hydrolase
LRLRARLTGDLQGGVGPPAPEEERREGEASGVDTPEARTDAVALGPDAIPALIRHVPDGRPKHAVFLIHGMRGSAPWLAGRLPLDECPGLLRVYVALPWLRDPGREALREVGRDDPVRKIFAAVVADGVRELSTVVDAVLARGDVAGDAYGLYGFSIGGLVALLGALADPRAAAVAVTGTVPNLDYLRDMLKGYDWTQPGLATVTEPLDALRRAADFFPRALLVQHGTADNEADPRHMRAFVDAVRPTYAAQPQRLRYALYEGIKHDLVEADTDIGRANLPRLRGEIGAWLTAHLGR